MNNVSDSALQILPLESSAKLLSAHADREAAHAAYKAAQRRVADLIDARERQISAIITSSNDAATEYRIKDVPAARSKIEIQFAPRLNAAQAALAKASQTLRSFYFLDDVDDWVNRAKSFGVSLRFVPLTTKLSGDCKTRITEIRDQLIHLSTLQDKLMSAPPSSQEAISRFDTYLSSLAAAGEPRVEYLRNGSPVDFGNFSFTSSGQTGAFSAIQLLAWLFRDEISKKVHALIRGTIVERDQAVTETDRTSGLAEILRDRLELEREEEACITAAIAEGHVVTRRRDMDPRAFLQVKEC